MRSASSERASDALGEVVIVGRGKVGRGLLHHAKSNGVRARLISGRRWSAGAFDDARLIVLAVPDSAIGDVAAKLVTKLSDRPVVVHCAGARGPSELDALRSVASIGAMHPLVSFASAKHPPEVVGTVFVISGQRRAVSLAAEFTSSLGANPARTAAHGAAYHAGAAMVANGAAALATIGVSVFHRVGLSKRSSRRAVSGLLRTVADNVERVGVPASLTGPVMRGDETTVRWHRAALRKTVPAALPAYDAIAPLILGVAEQAGLAKSLSDGVRRALRSRR